MKIALVVPAFVPAEDYGGPVAKAVSLGTALRDLGVDVEIWTSDFGRKRTRVLSGRRVVDGLPVRYLRRWAHYRWSPVVPPVVPLAWRADVDLAHLFGFRDGLTLPAAMTLFRRGVPYVVEMAGMTVPRYRNLALKEAFDRTLGRRYTNHAALVIANSTFEAEDMRPYVPHGRINLVYNPIPVPASIQPRAADPARPLRIAAIGRLAPVKNLDLLVRAVGEVSHSELDIIGPTDVPEVEASLRQLIERERLQSRVRLRGPLFGSDLRAALEHIDVVVMPSKSESFGNAVVEAALLGIAVVVSDRCGAAPLLERKRAGLVVAADDQADLVNALRRLDADRGLLAELAANGPSLRAEVAPEEVAKQHLMRYRRILAGEPPIAYGAT